MFLLLAETQKSLMLFPLSQKEKDFEEIPKKTESPVEQSLRKHNV